VFELWDAFNRLDTPSQFGVFGCITFVLGAILTFYFYRAKAELNEITTVHSYQSGELRRLCSDGFDAIARIEGKVSCDNPLKSSFLGLDCCWYRTKVEREEEHWTRNGMERTWYECSDETRSTVFKLSDEIGHVLVDPTRAEIQYEQPTVEIVDSSQPWFTNVLRSQTGRYRITEMVFLPGGHAYVLGQATAMQQGPEPDALIHYPTQGYVDPRRKYFIINRRTEAELVGEESLTLKICLWLSVLAYAFAAYCALGWLRIVPV
jgi:hypothetical protein